MEEVHKVSKRETKFKKDNAEMTFVEHLDDLRTRIFRGLLAIALFSVVAFFFKDFIFNEVILKPKDKSFITNRLMCEAAHRFDAPALCINQHELKIINIDLAGQFKAHLLVSVIFGFIIAFPYLVYQLWLFVKPAMKYKEYKYAKSMIFWVSSLFTIGVLFGYFIIVPLAINFLSTYSISPEVHNTINFASYFSAITTTSLGSGLVFEIPVAAYVLAKLGIVTPEIMKKYRKHAVVFAFILAGVLTPPDVFSQVLVAMPVLFLYEFSILIVKRVSKKREIEML